MESKASNSTIHGESESALEKSEDTATIANQHKRSSRMLELDTRKA